jgi:two-component system, chemotaxis family, chemotaxis protein CheY
MPSVLVVDDDPNVRDTICQILEGCGFEMLLAPDGKRGLALFRRHKPDLVITDIIMPEQEGLGLIREILAEAPEARILAISGGGRIGNADFLRMAQRFGAKDILPKPFDLDDLVDKVNSCLTKAAS